MQVCLRKSGLWAALNGGASRPTSSPATLADKDAMHDELLTLKNLGKTSAQWLHASGIHTLEDLRRLGAVGAYQAVKSRGFSASRVLLYAVEGALRDSDWKALPASVKDELNRHLDPSRHTNKS